ncbi:conserved hypothetical protein [Rhodobacter capsulatus SB 1003]|uniref:Uncharacterized protein n=1 Tax=Rhodobacter capsulatus (strain ATCC BAA-309 / NBRC 16581 / SB1003) TaxID=272942 RepID=D5AMM4_RHOCB|nr:conserved hypothetical protein [Rhodobacter capsulatus SB 1003]
MNTQRNSWGAHVLNLRTYRSAKFALPSAPRKFLGREGGRAAIKRNDAAFGHMSPTGAVPPRT